MSRLYRLLAFSVWMAVMAASTLQAQNHAKNWYFGEGAGLVFNGRYPMPLTDGKTASLEGVATISDSLGNLVCYSDGNTLWNFNHEIIQTDLAGNPSSTMSATLRPNRMNPDQYILFTTEIIINEDGAPVPVSGGQYYIVDFSDANPNGKIVSSYESMGNQPIQPNSVEKLLAIPFPDEIIADTLKTPGYWIITHEFERFTFRVSEFDEAVLDYQEVNVGTEHRNGSDDFGANRGASGYMAVSPKGDMLAVAIEGQKMFELFRFNNETGAIQRYMTLPAGEPGLTKNYIHDAYGVAFSPSGRFMYGTARDEGLLYQYDLKNPTSILEEVKILRHNIENPCGAIQLAPNGKMYLAIKGQDYLGVINRPDLLGVRADYEEYGASLVDHETGEGGFSNLGLPQFDMSSFERKHFGYDHNCYGDTTILFMTGGSAAGGYTSSQTKWTIIDPESGGMYGLVYADPYGMGKYLFPRSGEFDILVESRYLGQPISFTERIIIHDPPTVTLTQKDTTLLCRGDSLILDAGNGAFYEWADESYHERRYTVTEDDFSGFVLRQPYRVKVIDYNGCVGWDTVHVEIKSPIPVEFNYTRAVCGEPTGSAEVIPSNGIENCYYRWEDFPDNTTNKIENVAAGDYVVYVTSRFAGCESAEVAHVPEIGVSLATIEPSDTGVICPGESVSLYVSGEGATDYEWMNPPGLTEQTVFVTPLETTTYEVRVIAQEGDDYCEKTIRYTVRVQEVTAPEMETIYDLCEGDTLMIIAPEGYESYAWSTGDVGPSIQIMQDTDDLVLTVLDQYACESSVTLSATFHQPPEVDLGADITECTKDPITLSGGVGQEYRWNTGETSSELDVLVSGTYSVEIGDFGCFNSDTISVTIMNPDSLIIDSVAYKDISCFGANDGRIEMFVHGTGTVYEYSMDGGTTYAENAGIFDGLRPGYVYELAVKEDGHCVKVYETPIEIAEPDEIHFDFQTKLPNCVDCTNGRIRVTDVSGGTSPYSYTWNTMDTGPVLDGIPAGLYRMTLTDANNCSLSQEIELEVGLRIPDAFTPNGDGKNDTWVIRVLDMYPACQVQVYDRLGRLILERMSGYDNNQAWDGTFEGNPLPMGTYYYIIRLDPEKDPINGSLTIIR